MEKTEREISSLREWMIEVSRSMDQLNGAIKELSINKDKSGSAIIRVSQKGKNVAKTGEGESSQGRKEGGMDRSKYEKLGMPIFLGESQDSWVYRAKHFFYIHELSEDEKVKVAVVAFSPKVVDWFRWTNNQSSITSWEILKEHLFERYRPTQEGMLLSRLMRIEGTYAEYLKRFESFSTAILETTKNMLQEAFLNGLKSTLKVEVVSKHQVGLEACMKEAQT